MKHIIKQNNIIQTYDPAKLELSINKTLISCQVSKQLAQKQSKQITNEFNTWVNKKTEITSLDVRDKVTNLLVKHNKSASLLYKNHKQLW